MKRHLTIRQYVFVTMLVAAGWALLWTDRTAPDQAHTPPAAGALGRCVRVGRLAHRGIRESSGIVASRRHPGVYWTMNDSGNAPRLYAIDATGESLGAVTLTGARNADWEDIAADGRGRLYVGDIGDNARRRRSLTIYALSEPDPRTTARAAVERTFRFRYPKGHGPFDCEAMFVRGGWAYLITKETHTARLYRVRLDSRDGRTVDAEYLGPLPKASRITAADVSADGRHIAALSYLKVYVYDLPEALEKLAGATTAPGTRPAGPVQLIRARPRTRRGAMGQAEGICWVISPPGSQLLITNEAREVFRIRPAGAPTAPSTPER